MTRTSESTPGFLLRTAICEFCRLEMPRYWRDCPHCGRPARFLNVLDACEADETEALTRRYDEACREAKSRDCAGVVACFESAMESSVAVLARSLTEVHRILTSDREFYATFYKLECAGIRASQYDKWDPRRRVADAAFFPSFHEEIVFACLSLNGCGVNSYGAANIVLAEDMIAHRATVLECNLPVLLRRHNVMTYAVENLPRGCRAVWKERSKLAVVKHGHELRKDQSVNEFPDVIVKNGPTSEDDEYLEVHVYGSLSRMSIASLKIRGEKLDDQGDRSMLWIIAELASEVGITVEVL